MSLIERATAVGGGEGPGTGDGGSLGAASVRGDPAAIRRMWQAHRRWVAAILLAHKPREAELDDLLQDVAAIVVAKVGALRDEGALKPWLRTVAISVARTAARRRRPESWWRRAIGERREVVEDHGAERRGAAEEGRRLMDLAAELPEGYREPLLLKCVRGLSYRQIGELLGLPETTVETRIARGRRMLRERAEARETGGAVGVAAARADDDGGVGAAARAVARRR